MSPAGVPVRLADDEHALLVEEAQLAGQSLNRFIVTAAIGRALHLRGLRGALSPYDPPRRLPGAHAMSTDRIQALRAVCARYDVDTDLKASASGEDLAPLLAGDTPIGRYVAITAHNAASDAFRYATPCDTREAARERACAYITDSIHHELPVAIVDLDTGAAEPVAVLARWADELAKLRSATAAVAELLALKRELNTDYAAEDLAVMASDEQAAALGVRLSESAGVLAHV